MLAETIAPPRARVKRVWIAASALILLLLVLPFAVRLDGHPHADWQQFLGRFHPAVVHLPIGMVVLVPLCELAGRTRPALREAASFLLLLAIPACLLSVLLGYLLAYGSGTSGPIVTNHMMFAIFLTIGVVLCAVARPLWASGHLPYVYPALLAAVVLLLAWTGHQGGSITYGKNYLTEYLPRALRPGPSSAEAVTPGSQSSFYTQHIHPILDANCVACHGESKAKGGLRLDTYRRMMRGGEVGSAIVPGKPDQSILFKRITLPPTDKHFMPTDGKPPLSPEQIAWIKAWILDGASETAASVAGVKIAPEHKDLPLPQVGDYSKLAGKIEQTEKVLGIRLTPVSMKPGDGLILNAIDAGRAFGDPQLAQLDQLAPYIVEAELERTSVTDAGFDSLARFKHLRALHLENTAVTGSNLDQLTHLPDLTYLNLSGTRVTQASLAPASSIKTLQHLYLYNTPAQPASASPAGTPQ